MGRKTLLLVDDDGLVLATMSRELRESGYDVLIADDGEKGLALAARTPPPDLAILDIRMPGISGIELAALLRKNGIASIFLTAYDDRTYVEQAIAEGALGYLVKPIDVGRIIPTIETALHRSAELERLREKARRLGSALETGNSVNVAVGMLMEHYRLERNEAYELLRRKARSERRKVKEVADEVMAAWEEIDLLLPRPSRA